MRYSIIHHDVRKEFDLTMSAYLVCDSIHQLSHSAPTLKTNKEIAVFLGIDNAHTGHIIEHILIPKGLVIRRGEGLITTPKWFDSVTFASGKIPSEVGKSQQKWENPIHSIYKEDNNYKGEAPLRIENDSERRVKERRDTSYLRVFELWGKYPLNWKMNKTEIESAKNILAEGKLIQAKKMLEFFQENKDDRMCPQILKPSDLDSKWRNLVAYAKKQ